MQVILSRTAAMKMAWQIFWMATGTRRVGVIVKHDCIEIVGDKLIKE